MVENVWVVDEILLNDAGFWHIALFHDFSTILAAILDSGYVTWPTQMVLLWTSLFYSKHFLTRVDIFQRSRVVDITLNAIVKMFEVISSKIRKV